VWSVEIVVIASVVIASVHESWAQVCLAVKWVIFISAFIIDIQKSRLVWFENSIYYTKLILTLYIDPASSHAHQKFTKQNDTAPWQQRLFCSSSRLYREEIRYVIVCQCNTNVLRSRTPGHRFRPSTLYAEVPFKYLKCNNTLPCSASWAHLCCTPPLRRHRRTLESSQSRGSR
jgi:hypothetical protein